VPFEGLHRFLTDLTTKREIAGCVCWIGDDKNTNFFEAYGYAQKVPKQVRVDRDTIFDLASITKPIITALSIMQLYEKKKINIDDTIEKHLPDYKGCQNGEKTIKQLLTHTSGLPPWFPLYLLSGEQRTEYLTQTNTGDNGVVYSCLGYIVLGKIIEAVSGCSLDRYCCEHIFKKINLKNTMFGPVAKDNIAATECGNLHEKKLASKYGSIENVKWRDYVIKGEVHDGNSFYVFKGVSGNAGLFSNASDLAEIMRYYLTGEFVSLKSLTMMLRDYTGGEEKRGLGWVIDPYPQLFASDTFSHTGFTGTMLLVVKEAKLIVILLTNAVHPKVRVDVMPPVRYRVARFISNLMKGSDSIALS